MPPASTIGNEEVYFIVRTIKTPENQPKVPFLKISFILNKKNYIGIHYQTR